ncbi:MAG: DMT family transporter [Parachlamydiaceae bacterium]
MVQVFLMYALFGSIFSVGKVAVVASQPYFLTSMRMFLAGGCILSYLFLKHRSNLKVPRALWKLLILVAFFNVAITNAFEFWGLQYMNAGKTCLIYSLAPFVAAFFAYLFKTEVMTSKKWLGLVVGMLSLSPMMLEPWMAEAQGETNLFELLAECALVVSATTCVIGWHFVKKLTVQHQVPDAVVNGYSFLLAGIMCLMPSLLLEQWTPVPVMVWSDFFWTLMYIVIIHNLICYSIYAASLHRFSITFMMFAGLSTPIFAGLFGWLFLGEEITLSFIIALIGITAGLTIFSLDEGRQVITENQPSL